MKLTKVFTKTAQAANLSDLIINQGGSSSSKTYSALQYLLMLIQTDKQGDVTSIVAESLPHLKRGALRDMQNILSEYPEYAMNFNKTDLFYETANGARLEFFSADNPDKLRGARRKRLFINECNNIAYESYYQLAMRTSGLIILDFNPTSEFWVHTEILNNSAFNAQFIKSTYHDNEYCPAAAIAAIEARKDRDPNWYKVYGLGEIGSLEGRIFDFKIVKTIPPEFILTGAGLDFGFTNDPTAIPLIYKHSKLQQICIDEICYNTGLSNENIAKIIDESVIKKSYPVVADSAEPKSISELQTKYHLNITPCVKGADSVNYGIDIIKQYDILITEQSINAIREFRNYRWMTDKNGKALNIPVDLDNHLIDAARYAITKLIGIPQPTYTLPETL